MSILAVSSNRLPSKLLLFVALAIPNGLANAGDVQTSPTAADIIRRVSQVAKSSRRPAQYTEVRHYILHNARFKRESQMDVRVASREDGTLDFKVLTVTGSEQIFQRILDGEAALSRVPAAERELSDANYQFSLLGKETVNKRSCYVLQLMPRKQSKYLLEGRAWIDAAGFALVRVEGHPASSVSLWIGKPFIVREFEQRNGAWVAANSSAVSTTRLLGTTELSIQHHDYQSIQGRPLDLNADFVATVPGRLAHSRRNP